MQSPVDELRHTTIPVEVVRRYLDTLRPMATGRAVVYSSTIVDRWCRDGVDAKAAAKLLGCEPYWNAIEDRLVEWLV